MPSHFSLEWDHTAPRGSGEEATWGHLCITHGSTVLWGASRGSTASGIHWTWIDLLEHLARHWPWLVGEDGWPPHLMNTDLQPKEFESSRDQLLKHAASAARLLIDDALYRFRESHDLSLALRGKIAPRFWFVRQGMDAWIGGSAAVLVSFSEAEKLLVSMGDCVAERLVRSTDERSHLAIEAWKNRAQVEPMVRAEAILGVDPETIRRLFGDEAVERLELPLAGFESTELAFAARLAAPSLTLETTQQLLACIRRAPLRPLSAKLTALAAAAEASYQRCARTSQYPHDQGIRLGGWLRERLGFEEDTRVEPEELLAEWGVHCDTVSLDGDTVDAVACWGERHGPAVYVNDRGRRAQGPAGRRATIAHEIAHLLLDRQCALPLSEVQGALFRGRIEQRANAFAAELLIPQSAAGRAFAGGDDEEAARQILEGLRVRFGASSEVIAWQAHNSGALLSPDARRVLAEQVPPEHAWQILAAAGLR